MITILNESRINPDGSTQYDGTLIYEDARCKIWDMGNDKYIVNYRKTQDFDGIVETVWNNYYVNNEEWHEGPYCRDNRIHYYHDYGAYRDFSALDMAYALAGVSATNRKRLGK